MTNIRHTFAKNTVKLIAERTDLSVKHFCELNDVSRKSLETYNNGNNDVRVSNMLRACKALGCTPNDLLEGLY